MQLLDQPAVAVHVDASTVVVDTSATVTELSADEPNDSHSTSAQQDTNSTYIEPDIQLESDGDLEFYMNNNPHTQTTSLSKNSELAGDDDDEDDLDTVNRAQSSKGSSSSSNGSLATVAGAALERLADAIAAKETISGHRNQETEVYLEINDFNQQHTTFEAQLPREQSEATNQNNTTSLPPGATHTNPTTLKDINPNNESTNASISTTTTSSTESSVTTSSISQSSRSCDIDTSKDILTKGQAFAYVGLCLVTANTLFQALEGTETSHAKESL
ncbi:hypothetical protein BGX26_000245 [Mortierella sp. AD094]|nr:hypothetical protein BGX26_000245 [Mortierella sp. AD094]